MAKRIQKAKPKYARCPWCKKKKRLLKNGRVVEHGTADDGPGSCPGSFVRARDWLPKPVTTHPQARKRKRKVKR